MASVDNLFVLVAVFGLAIGLLVGIVLWNGIVDGASDVFDATSEGQTIQNRAQGVFDNVDTMFLLAFFGLHLGMLLLAFALRTHPIIYIAALLIVAILAIIAAPLSNTYESLILAEPFLTASADTPMMNAIMSQLPRIEVAFGFLTAIVLAGLAKLEDLI